MDFFLEQISDWQSVAKEINANLKHNIILLKGNLGAGKTTFTQFFVKELGFQGEVTSPTYSIVNEYQSPKGKIFHFDLYRLKSIEEAFDFGMEEYLENGFLSIIEWPEIYEEELQFYDSHEIKITNSENGRFVTFE